MSLARALDKLGILAYIVAVLSARGASGGVLKRGGMRRRAHLRTMVSRGSRLPENWRGPGRASRLGGGLARPDLRSGCPRDTRLAQTVRAARERLRSRGPSPLRGLRSLPTEARGQERKVPRRGARRRRRV